MLVFEERGETGVPEKNLSELRRATTTNSTHICRRCRDLNPGDIGGWQVLSPLRHPCCPHEDSEKDKLSTGSWVQSFHMHLHVLSCHCIAFAIKPFTFSSFNTQASILKLQYTVELPLSGHPLLSGQWWKSENNCRKKWELKPLLGSQLSHLHYLQSGHLMEV